MAGIPELRHIVRKQIISPLQAFLKDSRAMGFTLVVCTVVSLLVTNSSWGSHYLLFLEREIHFTDAIHLPHNLLHWINDGAMAVFFFLAGMEIKRELLVGELSSLKKASLPVFGALGGMLVPALIFLLINRGNEFHSGWGIPMATDIAFSLGIASLLSNRVPLSLKIFLMALAIIDDLGAIVVIAVFYGNALQWIYLMGALLLWGALALLTHVRKQSLPVTILGGLALWYLVYQSGIHASIAGVLLAFVVPLQRLSNYVHALHEGVYFIILPLFALANTAIVLPDGGFQALAHPLSWGVLCGLVIGKPLGITLFCWLIIRRGWSQLPEATNWKQLWGISILAGIGFTMSIFITMLAFQSTDLQNIAKLAILLAAVLSVLLGLLVFYSTSPPSGRSS